MHTVMNGRRIYILRLVQFGKWVEAIKFKEKRHYQLLLSQSSRQCTWEKLKRAENPKCSTCFCKAVVLTIPLPSWNVSFCPLTGLRVENVWMQLQWVIPENCDLVSSAPCVSVRVSQTTVNSEGCGKPLDLPFFIRKTQQEKTNVPQSLTKPRCWGMLLGQGWGADVAVGQRMAERWGGSGPTAKGWVLLPLLAHTDLLGLWLCRCNDQAALSLLRFPPGSLIPGESIWHRHPCVCCACGSACTRQNGRRKTKIRPWLV